jgi:pyruvate dehydrogenase E2 component (dihydrolipoamide acetyltransferase)
LAIKKITVPDLGDAAEVEVIELLVSVGQSVAEDDSLLVLESDKAAMEIPAPMSGLVTSIAVNLGDQVTTGTEMLSLEVESLEETDGSKSIVNSEDGPKSESIANSEDEPESIANSGEDTSAADDTKEIESVTVQVPDLGTEDEVDVIEIHVKVGDSVCQDDSLVTLESDKAAMEVPAPQDGKIEKFLLKVGDKVTTGAAIAVVKPVDHPNSVAQPRVPKKEIDLNPAETKSSLASEAVPARVEDRVMPLPSSSNVYAGPAVRKLARELGIDLAIVKGSGQKDRIVKEDIHAFVKNKIAQPGAVNSIAMLVPDVDFSKFGPIEKVERSKLAKITAVNMHRNWSVVPHVAQFNEADVTDLEDFMNDLKAESEKKGIKLTFLPFLLKACEKALKEYPQFNVSLHSSGEYLIQKNYFHIGVAMATDAGLVVPVVKNVDQKSIWDLAKEVSELNGKAKERKLSIEDMQGSCFSISSLGAMGGTGFIPIVNAPEVAILGVAKTEIKPVYIEDEFKPRKMLPLTLSYDHKVLNGLDGGLFSTYLARILADVRHLTL